MTKQGLLYLVSFFIAFFLSGFLAIFVQSRGSNMIKKRLLIFLTCFIMFFLGGFFAVSTHDFSSKYSSIAMVWAFLIYMASIEEINDFDLSFISGAWFMLSFLILLP